MLRTSRNSLGPSPLPAAAEPVGAASRPLTQNGGRAIERLARFAVVGLAVAGVLPPLAFIAMPVDLGRIGAVPTAIALTGLLILAPALAGLVAALFGLDGVRESFRLRGDKEHEQAVLRVFVGALAVAYGFAMAALDPEDNAAAAQIVASLGLAGAWVFLLLAIIDPVASPLRHYLATIFDAALLSAFLHFGAKLTAPWYPLYLLSIFYTGFRFGPAALVAAAIASLTGFAVTALTTPFWHEQALLAAGLIAALIVLPTYIGSMVREVAASRAEAAAAQAARTRFLMVISQALRAPLDAIIGNSTAGERMTAEREPEAPTVLPSARALLSQVNNILDFSAIEAGAFVPSTEAFDLHRVVNETLADRRAQASAKGLRLRVHIDPSLPYRLRGWPQQLAQILDYLVARAIEVTDEGVVRIAFTAANADDRNLRLQINVRDDGAPIAASTADAMFDPFAASAGDVTSSRQNAGGHGAFGLAVVKRLVELMGGLISIDSGGGKGGSFTIAIPLAIDTAPVAGELDLDHCVVLIATEDSEFASDLAEPLNAWHGDPRWIEGFDGTLGLDAGACSVLIVDGRHRMLAALSFAHRAVSGSGAPAFVLFIADAAQIDGLLELTDGEVDGVLPAPLGDQLLANALHSLPLWHGAPARPVMVATTEAAAPAAVTPAFEPAMPAAAGAANPVTPISAHPRFGADPSAVDPRAIAALRGLGGGDDFLGEVVESFRADAKEIMQRIVRAAAAADSSGFARGLHALRSCAANLGGTGLCELLLSLREVSGRELREQGSVLVQRLGDELARLDAALLDFLPEHSELRREA